MSAKDDEAARGSQELAYGSARGRWVLLATILGSGMAGIDATVVNVALPAIGEDFRVDFSALQWTVTAYTLTLASLTLLGGALGDRFGRRRVFVLGVVWFAAASLLCGAAPSAGLLVAARALQGVGAALLTPGSLALIQASFAPSDRSRAIGAWSGFGGVATAIGPLLGGWLIVVASWRWAFLINVPLAVVVVWLASRHVPESRDERAHGRVDLLGAGLAFIGLAGITYAIIEVPDLGVGAPQVVAAGVVGVLGLAGFVVAEARQSHPMMPLDIFASRQFSGANAVTFLVYAAFGGVFFMLAVQLQVVAGYSALGAGLAMTPITVVMLLLSARAGALAQRIGPRLPMTAGPLVCAGGVLLMRRIGPGAAYLTEVLPAVLLFALGLAALVAPLTATVLAAAEQRHAGVASGVNNAVARTAGLVAVAALPVLAGISGDAYADPLAFDAGFRVAMIIAAAVLACGSLLALVTISDPARVDAAVRSGQESRDMGCPIDGPPLTPSALAALPRDPGPRTPPPEPAP